MPIRRYENLLFLEGVLIGIYGNWFISYISRIEFSYVLDIVLALQLISIFISVAFFVTFCWISITVPRGLITRVADLAGLLHMIPIVVAAIATGQGSRAPFLAYTIVGAGLFAVIFAVDAARVGTRA